MGAHDVVFLKPYATWHNKQVAMDTPWNATAGQMLQDGIAQATAQANTAREIAEDAASDSGNYATAAQGTKADTATQPADLAAGLSSKSPQGLPSYAPAGLTQKFDPSTGLYGRTPVNNRPYATGLGKAAVGLGVCHAVFIGASDMSMFDGSNVRAPLSWPEYGRQTLAANGVPTGGTGVLPICDPVDRTYGATGHGGDSRLVFTGTWAQFHVSSIYTTTAGDFVTFTPDVAGGKFFLTYDNSGSKPPFTVKIGAAAAVTVTPTGGGTIGIYSVSTSIPAGTAIVITANGGGALVLYHLGTIGTTGYHKHNLARSSTGTLSAATGSNFDNPGAGIAKSQGSWDPAATGSSYSAIGPQSYAALNAAGVVADLINVSFGANDLLGGITTAQIIASLPNVVAAVPQISGGATVRLILPWHYYPITAADWEAYGTALYSLAETRGWQLADWRSILGNATAMANSGIIGSDAGHPTLAPSANFGRKLALADLAAA